ncbi:tetratricopeptide repeat protein [Paramagnetospirillum kuznetsovii]|uniref:tetratricopeptide repeat protein n=1 Tax=Paramagnetospirillum kuznetsovii TaxID=2053833 RepID=UPI001374E83B|nr:tetratricopeptide repeat protein [Paramagnetospirillum kuznetsovii]
MIDASTPSLDTALDAWRSGRLDQARAQAAVLVDEDPDSAMAWWLLGRVCLDMGDTTGAFGALSEAGLLAPDDISVALALAEAEWRNGDAVAALVRMAALPSSEAATQLAARLLTAQRPEPGHIPPEELNAFVDLLKAAAQWMVAREGWLEAAAVFHLVTRLSPDDLDAQCDLIGASARSCGMNIAELAGARRAIAAFRLVRQQAPLKPALWGNLGALLAALNERSHGHGQAAAAAAAHAHARWMALETPGSPLFPHARAGVADFLYSRRRMAEAAKVYRTNQVPEIPEIAETVLDAYLTTLDHRLERLERLLAMPPSPETLEQVGILIGDMGMTSDAAEVFNLALKAAPDNVANRQALADILSRHRLLVDAAALFANRSAVPRQPLVQPPPTPSCTPTETACHD